MIIAVDFDGTLCESVWPGIGEPHEGFIKWLKRSKENGDRLILWTMREDELLDEALEWCAEHGIEFDAVNDNTEEQKEMYGNNPRKIYADIYIDDHNLGGIDWEVFE